MSKNAKDWDFPGGLVVRVPGFHCRGLGSISGQGTEIPQAMQHGKKERKKGRKKERERKNKSEITWILQYAKMLKHLIQICSKT